MFKYDAYVFEQRGWMEEADERKNKAAKTRKILLSLRKMFKCILKLDLY